MNSQYSHHITATLQTLPLAKVFAFHVMLELYLMRVKAQRMTRKRFHILRGSRIRAAAFFVQWYVYILLHPRQKLE